MIKTKYLDLKNNKNLTSLKEPAQILKKGGLVIFPTETVYGLGANGLNKDAVTNIFKAKNRMPDNPLILHISDISMVKTITKDINNLENTLMQKFWPGPLTIILKKKDIVPSIVTGNLDTVGVRMPDNKIALKLIEYAGIPVSAPSANISGKPSGTNIEDIKEEFNGKVDYIIDGGDTKIGLESTVILVKDDTIHILRPGKITKEDLLTVTDKVIIDKNVLEQPKTGPVLSPGVKYRHYAPSTPCILIYSKDETKLIHKILEESKKYQSYLILAPTYHKKYFDNFIALGSTIEEISHNIFKVLRHVDKENVQVILIEGVEPTNLGLALMNRLLRACSYNYIEV